MTDTYLEVLTSGVTMYQDHGRYGYENVGVPTSGVFDPRAYTVIQRLLGETQRVVLEHLTGTFTIRLPRTASGPVEYAFIGGDHATQAGSRVLPGTVLVLHPGDTLTVHAGAGAPAWVGFTGLCAPLVLGSCSYDTFSRLGPVPIQLGDHLPVTVAELETRVGRFATPAQLNGFYCPSVVRYVPGPHTGVDLSASDWEVGSVTRSGIRLQKLHNVSLSYPTTPEAVLPSLPTIPGVIQVPPSGNPVVLGPDAGVTGGYPVAGVVITADLGKLAWMREGAHIMLVPVTVPAALNAHDLLHETMTVPALDLSQVC